MKTEQAEDQLELCDDSDKSDSKPPSIWFSKRFLVAILSFFGYIVYTFAQVISIAIVEMTTNNTEIITNRTIVQPPEFEWNSQKIGLVLNMFWYGFCFSIVGGYLSQKFGGVVVLGISIMVTGIITMLNPISVRYNFYLFLVARGFIGLSESFSSASYANIFARWVPKKERATVMSMAINGMYVGTAITYPFCGFLAQKWGWSMDFYVTGVLCIVWSIVWLLVVRNNPSDDKWISKRELEYILQTTENSGKKSHTNPYKQIFKSTPFWALSVGKFAFNWGSAFTVMYLPMFIKDLTQKSIKEIGWLAFIPNISIFINPIVGLLMDYWQNSCTLTITQMHKIVICGGFTLSAIFFAALTATNSLLVSILYFVIIKTLLSFNKIFLEVITVSMAPNHSSLLSGLSLFWQTTGIIVTQTIIGFIVKNHELAEWNICFLLSTGVLILSAIIFLAFGSSEPQPWSIVPSSEDAFKKTKLEIQKPSSA